MTPLAGQNQDVRQTPDGGMIMMRTASRNTQYASHEKARSKLPPLHSRWWWQWKAGQIILLSFLEMMKMIAREKITWHMLTISQFGIDLFCWWSICHFRVWGDKFGTDHCIIWSIRHSPNWSHKFYIDPEGVAVDWWAKCPNLSDALVIVVLDIQLWYNKKKFSLMNSMQCRYS